MDDKRPDQRKVNPGEADSSGREGHEKKDASPRREKGGRSDDERVDEASEESFPASDPPSQP
jgi:hypothetical protein